MLTCCAGLSHTDPVALRQSILKIEDTFPQWSTPELSRAAAQLVPLLLQTGTEHCAGGWWSHAVRTPSCAAASSCPERLCTCRFLCCSFCRCCLLRKRATSVPLLSPVHLWLWQVRLLGRLPPDQLLAAGVHSLALSVAAGWSDWVEVAVGGVTE